MQKSFSDKPNDAQSLSAKEFPVLINEQAQAFRIVLFLNLLN